MRIPSRALKGALATVIVLALLFAFALMRTHTAQAYGRLAQWQIGLSFNCDNPTFCGSQLGGFWGWAEFDSDNTGDAEVTGCEHLQGGRAGGAQHVSIDVTGWTIGTNGDFFITSEVDTITGRTGGPPIVINLPSENFDTGVPAAAGHFSSQTLFGMQAPPGTNFEIQVAQLNH
jgi:hypothetical protein